MDIIIKLIYCIFVLFIGMCVNKIDGQNAMDLAVLSGQTMNPSCSNGDIMVFDSVIYGDSACSVKAYRQLSTLCLGKSTCAVTASAITGCSGTTITAKYRCIKSSQLIDICSAAAGTSYTNSLLYITTPTYPSEYSMRMDCGKIMLNTGSQSSLSILDISTQSRTPPSVGCYDRLRIFYGGIQQWEACGDDILTIKGVTSTTISAMSNLELLFLSDEQANTGFQGFIVRVEGSTTTTTTGSTTTTTATTTTTSLYNNCKGQNPCKNFGVCKDELGTFVCICTPGYLGRICDQACAGATCGSNSLRTTSSYGYMILLSAIFMFYLLR